ncbi:kinase-like protein [Trametopsis cervina]|nr:kinase-like protein [Trametopsis cervina]
MTRLRDNSPLHRNDGTGFVPPLEAPLSVVLCCGLVAAILVASVSVLGFGFGSGSVSSFVIPLTPLALSVLSTAGAFGLRLLDIVLPLLHVGLRFLSDTNWSAPFSACYRFLELVTEKRFEAADALLASDFLADPEAQQWLIRWLTVAFVLFCIQLVSCFITLDSFEAPCEDPHPCSEEEDTVRVEEPEEIECDVAQSWCLECFAIELFRPAQDVQGEDHGVLDDVVDASLDDEDEQYGDAVDETEYVSLVDGLASVESFDAWGEDGDEDEDEEEDEFLDAEEDIFGVSLLQESVDSYQTASSEEPETFNSAESTYNYASFAAHAPEAQSTPLSHRCSAQCHPAELFFGSNSSLEDPFATFTSELSLAESTPRSTITAVDQQPGDSNISAGQVVPLSGSSSSGSAHPNDDSDDDDDYSGDAPTPRPLLLPLPTVDDDPFTSPHTGNAPPVFNWGPNRNARMFSKHFPEDYLLHPEFAGKYVLARELGSGGNAFVMSARHRETGDEVAVKFMAKAKVSHSARVALSNSRWVPREVVLAYNVDHPNIIRCVDNLYDDHMYFYIIQELHGDTWYHKEDQGNSLWDYMMEVGQLPESTARHIFRQIVSGVDALHKMGISHCDLKLENVLIDRKLNVKIIDLGSAVLAAPGAIPPKYTWLTFCGTLSYAAPEILAQLHYEAAPADVWSLGVILYELVTGLSCTDPIRGPDELANDGVLDGCTPEVQSLVLEGCLNVDPEMRATVAEVLGHPWMRSS